MGSETRTTATDLIASIQQDPTRYGFFQALRLLECAFSDKTRFGQSQRPKDEPPIRLGQTVSLGFQPSTLSNFTVRENLPPLLKQYFLGLFGANGPMPLHLTEYIHERNFHHRDRTLTGFADLFQHRFLCLFYRAFANNEPTINFDRPETDKFSTYVGSLAGYGQLALRERDAMPDLAKFYYTGLMSSHSKSAEGLKRVLADFFRLKVSVQQFVGEWLTMQHGDLTRLGENPLTGELGTSAILGSNVWSCQHKFRIRFDKLNLTQYLNLLPNGHRLDQLTAIVRNYNGDQLSWDVQLVLKKDEVPKAQLGETTMLGWTSWLGERSSDNDADDLKLNPFWGKL